MDVVCVHCKNTFVCFHACMHPAARAQKKEGEEDLPPKPAAARTEWATTPL